MSYEFRVKATPQFWQELQDAAGNVVSGIARGPVVASANYLLLNAIANIVREFVGGWLEYKEDHYSIVTTRPLHELVIVREAFQEWEDKYSPDFYVLGAWSFDGQPIGGVGSPWFVSPPGEVDNAILVAGQAPRSIV